MRQKGLFNFGQSFRHDLMGGQNFTKPDKGFDQCHADGHRAWAMEDIGRHQDTVFRENIRQIAATAMET